MFFSKFIRRAKVDFEQVEQPGIVFSVVEDKPFFDTPIVYVVVTVFDVVFDSIS